MISNPEIKQVQLNDDYCPVTMLYAGELKTLQQLRAELAVALDDELKKATEDSTIFSRELHKLIPQNDGETDVMYSYRCLMSQDFSSDVLAAREKLFDANNRFASLQKRIRAYTVMPDDIASKVHVGDVACLRFMDGKNHMFGCPDYKRHLDFTDDSFVSRDWQKEFDSRKACYVQAIEVRPEFRRQGIATKLMRAFEDTAKKDYDLAYAYVKDCNMQDLLIKLKYENVGSVIRELGYSLYAGVLK